jgi:hypothetical protein
VTLMTQIANEIQQKAEGIETESHPDFRNGHSTLSMALQMRSTCDLIKHRPGDQMQLLRENLLTTAAYVAATADRVAEALGCGGVFADRGKLLESVGDELETALDRNEIGGLHFDDPDSLLELVEMQLICSVETYGIGLQGNPKMLEQTEIQLRNAATAVAVLVWQLDANLVEIGG